MTKTRSLWLFIAFLVAYIPSTLAQPNAQVAQKIIDQLEAFRSVYSKGMSQANMTGALPFFTASTRFMPEFQKTLVGRAPIQIYYTHFFKRFEIRAYELEITEITDLGDQVLEIGQFQEELQLKNTETVQSISGKYMQVWEKGRDGHLTLLTRAWNYNQQLAIEEELRFEEISGTALAFQSHLPIDSPIRFELAALNDLMETTITEHDAGIWAQFYADDAMFLYSRNPTYHGRKSLNDFLKIHAAEMPIFEKLDIRHDRIDDLGTYVVEYATHIAIIRKGDFSGVFTGKDLRIWRREPDCSLKLFRHIAMYN